MFRYKFEDLKTSLNCEPIINVQNVQIGMFIQISIFGKKLDTNLSCVWFIRCSKYLVYHGFLIESVLNRAKIWKIFPTSFNKVLINKR